MRVLHTSDWHLGQSLHGQDRDLEHQHFLNWLLDQLQTHDVDALLIAGDIFDTLNPSLKAQERLYDFIVEAHQRMPHLHMVMIAGNHDSGARIELPSALMRRLNAHAVGRIHWLDDGQLDHQRLLVPLPNRDGDIAAWCLTLPFLRPAEVTGHAARSDYLSGIRQVHQQLIAAAQAQRQPHQALIAMSHAHLMGGAVSEDSERNIVIGTAEALPASLFPECISYVALGHLHKPQRVNQEDRLRYCGSPIPLSFAEVNYPHQVLLVEFDNAALKHITALPVPRAIDMQRIGWLSLEETLEQLHALPEGHLSDPYRPWLEVRVTLNEPLPDLRQPIEQAIHGKAARLVRIHTQYQRAEHESDQTALPDLDQIQPVELFTRAWQNQYGTEPDDQVLNDFATLLHHIEHGEEPSA